MATVAARNAMMSNSARYALTSERRRARRAAWTRASWLVLIGSLPATVVDVVALARVVPPRTRDGSPNWLASTAQKILGVALWRERLPHPLPDA
jgi:hypothetical protein